MAEKEIDNIKGDIVNTEQEITIVQANLAQVEQEMTAQIDNLQKRLRAMYKNGDIAFVQILLGSDNIADFMTNMDMEQKIYENDVEILKSMENQYQQIEVQKKELEALQASRGEVANLKSQVARDNAMLEAQIDEYNKEADRVAAEIRKLQGIQPYTGGVFSWPSASTTRGTSEFGYRIHPILKVNKLHTGNDIGATLGTNALAGNSGTVIKADGTTAMAML